MKKSNLAAGILYVLFGAACLIAALIGETKLEGILWGFAGAGIVPGLMMIFRYFYWTSPKNSARYEDLLEKEKIEMHDELKTKIRNEAGRYTYTLGIWALLTLRWRHRLPSCCKIQWKNAPFP